MVRHRLALLSNHGKPMSQGFVRRSALLVLACLLGFSASWAQKLPDAPSAQKTKQTASATSTGQKSQANSSQLADKGWPRTFTKGADTFAIYQPQVDKWDANRI